MKRLQIPLDSEQRAVLKDTQKCGGQNMLEKKESASSQQDRESVRGSCWSRTASPASQTAVRPALKGGKQVRKREASFPKQRDQGLRSPHPDSDGQATRV